MATNLLWCAGVQISASPSKALKITWRDRAIPEIGLCPSGWHKTALNPLQTPKESTSKPVKPLILKGTKPPLGLDPNAK